MSGLLLIRHGQASLEGADYDVLSPLGREQARRLGDYLGRLGHLGHLGQRIDVWASGPLRRQRDTARLIREAAATHGLLLPEATIVDALAEFPAIPLIEHSEALTADDPDLAAHRQRYLEAAKTGDPQLLRQTFEPLFQGLLRRWVAGEVAGVDDVEPYDAFQARIEAGLRHLFTTAGRGAEIAAVTSAGPIGAALRLALNLAPWDAMRATFVVANASLSAFKHRPGELTLTHFNAAPHLDEPGLLTLR